MKRKIAEKFTNKAMYKSKDNNKCAWIVMMLKTAPLLDRR